MAQTPLIPEKTCRLVTLGCRVNQYETQLVQEALERSGYRMAAGDEAAELCVVNTCTVTHTGDSKSRQVIRQLAKANPGCRTIVMGCYATRDPAAVEKLPSVSHVVTDKRELPDLFQQFGVLDFPEGISRFTGHKRAFVKIQDGCILNCTYCIIPKVRPGLRTRPAAAIVDEVRRLVDNGYHEIVLTGIHIGHYGVETTRGRSGLPPYRLGDLLRELDRIPGHWRMRLSSIEAAEMNANFIAAATQSEHLCEHFHPALQSGSESVLRRMRRRYSVERFLHTLDQIQQQMDLPAFSTDIIVGFPGETDAEFAETLETCRRAGFMKIHAFPFSARRGTAAATMPDQIPPEIIAERMQQLAALEHQLAQAYYQQCVGRSLEVIVEGTAPPRPGWVCGTDRRYLPVELPGTTSDAGRLTPCQAVSVNDRFVVARRVAHAVPVIEEALS